MNKIHCNWQCTPRLHRRAALLLCALHAQISLRNSRERLLYSKLFSASHSISTGVIPRDQSRRGIKLTTHLHRLPKLAIRAAIPLHPLYAFTAWTRKISSIPLPLSSMLYRTQNRFHPTLLYSVCANTNLSYTFQKFTCSVFYITF
jgi:hypothetical protein